MAHFSKKCYLQCVRNFEKRINLPHETPMMIGRNEETGITDLKVSRNHLECTANLDKNTVLVKTLGKNYSGCNGYALIQGETYTLKHGARIEVGPGLNEFDIHFEQEEEENPPKKAKIDIFNVNLKKTNFVNSGKWIGLDGKKLLVYTTDGCEPQSKIASFDLDGTIIKTKSKARFPKDDNDWEFNINSIPQKLHQLFENGHKIVFFTNQSGLGNDPNRVGGYKGKVEAIISKLCVPVDVYIATSKTIYRKPAPGMWNVLEKTRNGDKVIDFENSFFVGDAAGRAKNWAPDRKKDHSICDRLFALNLGLKFYTPEEYFLKQSNAPFVMPEFDPRHIPLATIPNFSTQEQEVIIMVGSPASGKSQFSKTHLVPKGYVHVSRDILNTWQKCVTELEKGILKKQSVVIDNTNPDKESRKKFVEVAKKHGISCRCFVMMTTLKHAKHNNRFREMTDKDKEHKPVGEMVLNSYKKAFQEPELSEGFAEIVKIPFVPKFSKEDDEKLYKMFLLED